MKTLPKVLEYKLKVPFEYASKGTTTKAKSIVVYAPSFALRKEMAALKKVIKESQLEQMELFIKTMTPDEIDKARKADAEKKKKSAKQEEDDLKLFFKGCVQNSDPERFAEAFLSLLTAATGNYTTMVDGQEPLTETLMDYFSIEDYEALAEQYLENFMASSLT